MSVTIVQLGDVEAEVVEPADPLVDAVALAGVEGLGAEQLVPQVLVALDDLVAMLDRVDRRVQQAAGLEVEQLAGDVGAGQVDVVRRAGPRTALPCSSPVSASTRYAAKAPASRRNSVLENEQSPQ